MRLVKNSATSRRFDDGSADARAESGTQPAGQGSVAAAPNEPTGRPAAHGSQPMITARNVIISYTGAKSGPAVIDGSVIGDEIRGTVRRKDPKDDGLTGTITAKIAGDSAEGKPNLSEANAAIVREANTVLKKK